MKPVISVIVPVYQVERYLEECVHSIAMQTYADIEIILVDDGSTDKSGAICDQLARQDARIRVIHQSNGGLSAARNAGMDAATGEYLSFVDSDDYLDPSMYEKMLRQMQQDGSDMACCGLQRVTEQGALLETREQCGDEVFRCREYQSKCFGLYSSVYSIVCNKLFKRAAVGDLRFPQGKLHEDEFFHYRAIDRAATISTLSERLYFYRQRGDSIMGTRLTRRNLDVIEAFLEKAVWYRAKEDNELMERSLRQVCTVMAGQKRLLNMRDAATRERYAALKRQFSGVLLKDGWRRISWVWRIGGIVFLFNEALFLKIYRLKTSRHGSP